jgi:hypothetical protein
MSEEPISGRERIGDCKERVVYDLMRLIAKFDAGAPEEVKRDAKKFWLDLYKECREAVEGTAAPRKRR